MSGILIYYWARLWIQQSIGLIDNTASSASPLSFWKLSFRARSRHNSLCYCLPHPLEIILGCVLSILSRGVLLSWAWIRFFPSHCHQPAIMRIFGAHVSLRYCSIPSCQAWEDSAAAFRAIMMSLQTWNRKFPDGSQGLFLGFFSCTSLGWLSMIHNLIFAKQFLKPPQLCCCHFSPDRTDGLSPPAQIHPDHFKG